MGQADLEELPSLTARTISIHPALQAHRLAELDGRESF
jgi:hypothetical protein